MATATADSPPLSADVPVPAPGDQGYAQSAAAKVPLPPAQASSLPEPTPTPKPFSNAPAIQIEKPKPFSNAAPVQVEQPPKSFSTAPPVQVQKPFVPPEAGQQPLDTVTDQQVVAQPDTSSPGTFTNPATGNIQQLQTQAPAIPPKQQPTGQVTGAPTGTPDQPWGQPLDQQHQIRALIDSGKNPGEAQAIVNGQQPTTISGDKPAPTDTQPQQPAKPQTEEQAYQSLSDQDKALYDSGKSKLESAPAGSSTNLTPAEQAVLDKVKAQVDQPAQTATTSDKPTPILNSKGQPATYDDLSPQDKQLYDTGVAKVKSGVVPSDAETHALQNGNFDASTLPQDMPKTVNNNRILGTATTFGTNYDGSWDKDDNGVGFFGGVNTRNPKLKAVAVPVDVLEATFGKFTQKNAEGGYDALQTPEAKAIIAKIQSAHVEALDVDGKVHKFPIVDIQGSLKGHPGKVLDMTPAAGRDLGFHDNHAVSYQIVGGDGKPFPIPADQLAGWNAGDGGKSGGHKGGGGGGGGGDSVMPNIPLGSSSPQQPQSPVAFNSGGGRAPSYGTPGQSDSGSSVGGEMLASALAGAAAGAAFRGGQQQRSAPPPDDGGGGGQPQNPMVAALIARGFTPQQAANFAQSSANVAPGKGIGPLQPPGPPPAAPGALPASSSTALNLSMSQRQPMQAKLLPAKQLMPGKVPPIVPKQAPAAPGASAAQPSTGIDPSAVLGLMKRGFTREQAMAVLNKATVSKPGAQATTGGATFRQPPAAPAPATSQQQAPARQPQQAAAPPPPAKPPSDQPKRQLEEPTAFGRPAGSTRGDPTPPGHETIFNSPKLKDQALAHAAILSPDDPRVKKQADGKIKGEHFVDGDPWHEDMRSKLPYGKGGRQDQLLGHTQEAIADSSPMHISYISSPKEAETFPTRESRRTQYEKHTPEARLMGTTEGQLVGHSMIPVSMGIKLPERKGEPHESYVQGISTNVMANNFQHINDKLETMGRKTPYKNLGAKFYNDLEGYFHNLNAGHTATGRGYATGTDDHPNEPDRSHVPYKLSRKEADFIGAVINNTSAFAKHDDAKKIRELARANGTLITEAGETNRMLHDIEQADPGWSGRGSGKKGRVLEPSIKTFKTGLIHEIHPSEEHMPETIRPGKEYQSLTKSIARTSERGRPDIAIGASLHHTFEDNRKINQIERDFSEHRIDEGAARARLQALGEDPEDYRYVGGSGGLITPYEDDPEALTPEEHSTMKDNLRQQWVGGKLNVEDYRRKSAEIPLPQKPSQPKAAKPAPVTAQPVEAPEAPQVPPVTKPLAPKPPKPPKPKAPPKLVEEPEAPEPEEQPETPQAVAPAVSKPAQPPGPGEPLPAVKAKPAKAPKKAPEIVPPPTGVLEKPSWKTANEKTRQAYLRQRVTQDLAKQYKGADAHPLEVDKGEDNQSIKYDPAGNPIYKKIDYDLANSPLLKKKGLDQIKDADKHEDTLGNLIGPDGKEAIDPETGKPVLKHAHLNETERRRLSAMHTASAVHTMGNKIVDEFMNNIKDQPDIMAGEGWYSRMRKKLADALGEHHELFAQLLGATSAKTPVRNNFIQSLDALEQYKSGKFDNHIKKYQEAFGKMQEGKGALVQHMKNQGIPLYDKDGNTVEHHDTDAAAMANWIHHHGILPRQMLQQGQAEGSKYNANSVAVLRALSGTWLKEIGAPKTPNFAGNLTGRTLEATIDVWAARFLKRLGYEGHGDGPWRSQGKSEPGVNSLDFAFSQDAMRHAADEITKRTGKKMNPDDLQAIAWFAEKHHWEKRGWTRGAGAEKSSFDDVADLAFPKTGEPMTSSDLRKHYGAIQAEAKRVKARVKTAKTYVGNPNPKMAAKLAPYMEQHGLTHEQVHGPETAAEEEDEDEAA